MTLQVIRQNDDGSAGPDGTPSGEGTNYDRSESTRADPAARL